MKKAAAELRLCFGHHYFERRVARVGLVVKLQMQPPPTMDLWNFKWK
jgi:hypothetical protein